MYALDIMNNISRNNNDSTTLEAEDMDENFFYKELTNSHFYSLFCQSTIVCIPHSKVIQGLVITKDIMESHCFQPSPYFRGQYIGTRQKQKIISLDSHCITTLPGSSFGFKEKRTVQIIAEETYYLNNKRIRILSIDHLLQGEAPKHRLQKQQQQQQKQSITIPSTRNFKTDLEFLNMFPENHEALHELQLAVQEFSASYVYIKGYNRTTVERIQHICTNTCEIILQRNRLLRDSCRVPSEHEQFLELVENVVMGYLHKKIWYQTLQPLLSSQDTFVYNVCLSYTRVTTLAHYSIRYPLSEMSVSCFEDAIEHFNQVDQAITPLEKSNVVKSTLDRISLAVADYIKENGNDNTDTSITADEIIPLLAFVIVQSSVTRIASLVYYLQYYRLVKIVEGSIHSFVVITLKAACEFLKGDPLSLESTDLSIRSRSNSFGSSRSSSLHLPKQQQHQHYNKPHSAPERYSTHQQYHRKSQSAEIWNPITMDNSHNNSTILRPHSVNIMEPHDDNDDNDDLNLFPPKNTNISNTSSASRHLELSKPMVSTTFSSISSPLPASSSSIRTVTPTISPTKKQAPDIIYISPKSKKTNEDEINQKEELMGDFLTSLKKTDGNVVGARTGSFKIKH